MPGYWDCDRCLTWDGCDEHDTPHIDDSDICQDCGDRHASSACPQAGEASCHCGRPVVYGFDMDPSHHRGMCFDCDEVRCDAYPLECPYRFTFPESVDG